MLEVRLRRGLQLLRGGSPIPLPSSRRARSLLAFLAVHPGVHGRAHLASKFWPDVLDESARASLRVALTELRQALGPAAAYVIATRETVALDGPDLRVDVREFQAAVAIGDLRLALAAVDAPILDGFDDEWALQARDDHAHALAEVLAGLAAAAPDEPEAIRLARCAVALEPLSEAPNRDLIERLLASGDRAAAVTAARQFTERLRTQLGIAPSRDTRALLEGLRRQEPAPLAPSPALAREYDTPFVGRGGELRRLEAAWRGVRMQGSRRIVLVAGEPGIGKTRLALEFATHALAASATVLHGRCSEEPLAPFEPFAEALTQAGIAGALQPGAADDPGARIRLLDAVDGGLADLAARAPLLILLDDFHWADRATLLLASYLLRSNRSGPLLLLGTYRDTELGRRTPLTGALGDLSASGVLERIQLRALTAEDVSRLTEETLGSADLASRVHALTGGNPFFVEEVLRELAGSGTQTVPESVRHAIGVRLSRMSDDASELIAAAAILGLEHDARALPATAGLEQGAAEAALDELLRARMLLPTGSAPRFAFAHALVRQGVLDECNALRRCRLHRRAADALAALGEDAHLEEIAAHLFGAASAADAERAAEMLGRAGDRALRALAYEDAADSFARALEALELAGDEPAKASLLLRHGDALMRAGESAAARRAFDAARMIAVRLGDDELLARAALGYAGLGVAIVDIDAEVVDRLSEALERVDDLTLRSRLQARLGVELYYASDRTLSDRLSADAVESAREAEDPGALASALGARRVALWRPDRVQERLAVTLEMAGAARLAGDRAAELQACNWRVTDLFELGDMAAWRAAVSTHAKLADELRLPVFQWYGPLWRGVEATLAGDYEEAERLLEVAGEQGCRAGDRNAELFPSLVRFFGLLQREAYEEMPFAFVEEKIANSAASHAYRGGYAWVLAAVGRTGEARAQLDQAMSRPHPFDANWLSFQAECAEASALLGEVRHGRALYDLLVGYAGRHVTAGRAACSYGAIDRHLGALAALIGRPEDAARHYAEAIRVNERLGAVVWQARALGDLARLNG